MKFTDLKLKPALLKAIKEVGYEDLTPIQEQTINHILAKRDLLALAETGSGKTSACAIPLIQQLEAAVRGIQALILVPTRELALQYVDEIDRLCRYLDLAPFAIYGGFSMEIQKAKLRDCVHILVATPGRLIDHLYSSDLTLENVRTLVLDEADEMLNMGFIDDVRFIMSCIVNKKQTLLFSATMPPDINRLAADYMRDPVTVALNLDEISPASISHHFQYVNHRKRQAAVTEYLRKHTPRQTLIFCNSRRTGENLFRQLAREHDGLEYIHGGLDQGRRTSIFNRFKKGAIKVLLATDVAGRGLDFSKVSHVINYDFPQTPEIYTHRTGRTGRMGRHGVCLTLVTGRDLGRLKHMLKANSIEPHWEGKVPDLENVRKKAPGNTGPRSGKKSRRAPGRRRRKK